MFNLLDRYITKQLVTSSLFILMVITGLQVLLGFLNELGDFLITLSWWCETREIDDSAWNIAVLLVVTFGRTSTPVLLLTNIQIFFGRFLGQIVLAVYVRQFRWLHLSLSLQDDKVRHFCWGQEIFLEILSWGMRSFQHHKCRGSNWDSFLQ